MTARTVETVGADVISVSTHSGLVSLDNGTTMMCEGLNAEQARELARALIAEADEAERA